MERLRVPVGAMTFDGWAAGPPQAALVLLLHGFPQTSYSWRGPQHALAAAGYRAVAVDQRGYSPDARPAGLASYRVTELVGDVLRLADALAAERCHLVGHDWGAAVAWQVAARHPDRLASLTAVSVPHPLAFTAALQTDPDQRRRSTYLRRFREPDEPERVLLADGAARLRAIFGDGLDPAAVQRYVTHLSRPGALTAALAWYRAASAADLAGLGPVTTPTLYVWSTADPALGRTAAEATAAQVSGPYRFEVLDGVTHWVPEQAAERLSALLVDHLAAAP